MNDQRRENPFRERDAHAAGPGDEQLRRRFGDLRREDEWRAPQFAALWRSRQRKRQRLSRWFAAGASAVLVLAGLLWLRSVQHGPENAPAASITAWKAPTDFLLETPGRELLRTVPAIGGRSE